MRAKYAYYCIYLSYLPPFEGGLPKHEELQYIYILLYINLTTVPLTSRLNDDSIYKYVCTYST